MDGDGGRGRPQLVVVSGDPPALQRWLTPETLRDVLVLPSGGTPEGVPGLPQAVRRSVDVHGSGWDLVRLPLDGPPGALRLAIGSLRGHLGGAAPRTAVIVESDRPPSPAVVRIVSASLTPGIDLSGVGWATEERVWLTGRDGVATLRHDASDHRQAIELADAVQALCPMAPGSPARRWVEGVSAGEVAATLAGWDDVLRAGYLEAAVAAIRDSPAA